MRILRLFLNFEVMNSDGAQIASCKPNRMRHRIPRSIAWFNIHNLNNQL